MSTTVDHAVQLGDRPSPAVRGLLDGLPAYEKACFAVEAARMSDPEASAALLARWFDGVALLDAISQAKSDAGRPDGVGGDAEPRVVAALTHLATAWLTPRFAGEPRNEIRKRVADLRPAYESAELIELMGKNTEGMLTPVERNEFLRLHKFFEMLQDIVDTALYPNPAEL